MFRSIHRLFPNRKIRNFVECIVLELYGYIAKNDRTGFARVFFDFRACTNWATKLLSIKRRTTEIFSLNGNMDDYA